MTTSYSPRVEWVRDDLAQARTLSASTPTLGPLVDGDLCDILVSPYGQRRRYCHAEASRAVVDADGRERLLCAAHVAMYFPTSLEPAQALPWPGFTPRCSYACRRGCDH